MPKKVFIMRTTYTTQDVQNIVSSKFENIKVLSYTGKQEPVHMECTTCGHSWTNRGETVTRLIFKGCPKCTNNIKRTQADYEETPNHCKQCGKTIPWIGKGSWRKEYCNNSCSATYHNNLLEHNKKTEKSPRSITHCLSCGKELPQSAKKFCNTFCQSDYNFKQWVIRYKSGHETGINGTYGVSHQLRRYLFEKHGHQCARCGWHEVNPFTGKIPLEVEHIDGDYTNNKEENLTLLCPNCHSLTATYKGANKGSGRKERAKYYVKKSA